MEEVTVFPHQLLRICSRQPGLVCDGAVEQVVKGVEIRQEPPIFGLVTSVDCGVGSCENNGVFVDCQNSVGEESLGVRRKSFVCTARDQRAAL